MNPIESPLEGESIGFIYKLIFLASTDAKIVSSNVRNPGMNI